MFDVLAANRLATALSPCIRPGCNHAKGIDVYYQVSGQQYHLQTATHLAVLVAPTCGAWNP